MDTLSFLLLSTDLTDLHELEPLRGQGRNRPSRTVSSPRKSFCLIFFTLRPQGRGLRPRGLQGQLLAAWPFLTLRVMRKAQATLTVLAISQIGLRLLDA